MAKVEYKFEKLTASNYSTWKTVIKSQLMGKDLWDVVVETKYATDEEIMKNEKAKSVMYMSMESAQIAATGVCRTAHDLWIKIKENHEGAVSNLRSSSLAEFLSLKHQKNESLVNYSGRFENALGKLESTGQVIDEKTKLWVFSNSLPQHMKITVHMFEMANPEGRVSELISQLKIHHHMDRHDSDRQASAYHIQEARRDQVNAYKRLNDSSRNLPKQSSQIICNYCKFSGHVWRECRKLKADNERKKRFGQANQQRQMFHKPAAQLQQNSRHNQASHQNQRVQHSNSNSGAFAAAFPTPAHTFSDGKFTWIVDSGASSHITPYREFLVDYESFEAPHPIIVGDGKEVEAHGKGNMPFASGNFTGELKNVLWVPQMSENLFSITRTMEHDCSVEFCNEDSTVYFYRDKQIVLTGSKKPQQHYFLLDLQPVGRQQTKDSSFLGASYEEWHKRLGHCSMDTVKALVKSGAVEGLTISNEKRHECTACITSKMCRAHHPQRNDIQANEQSAVLHIDTVGKMRTASIGGSTYFVLATEEYSGYMLFETMASKASIPDAVKCIINKTELLSGRPVKAILTDNGTEFTNANLGSFLRKKGVIHNFSVAYTPEQNGRAERANRTILNAVRTLLCDSKLTEEFWAEALNTAVYTTNRIISKRNPLKTRYELLIGKKPNLSNLKIFGQRAIVRENEDNRAGKLAPRGDEVTFVGYTSRSNTYRFYTDKPSPQIFESCDAKFICPNEQSPSQTEPQHETESSEDVIKIIDDDKDQEPQQQNAEDHYETANSSENATIVDHSDQDDADSTNSDLPIRERESFDDYEPPSNVEIRPEIEPRVTRSKSQARGEGPSIVGIHIGAMFTLDNEPRTIKDAEESAEWDDWRKAMDEEINALEKNKTWILVDRPQNVKPIKNKWVFKVKLSPDGSIERYKARLVAKGYTQIENVDYKETYAPVASMNAIRMILAIANQESMHMIQFDIKTAFLYGDLEEELYMEQPEHYAQPGDKVCKLIKSLYGLKQAPRQWNKKFDAFLKLFELEQSRIDKCIYFNTDRSLLLAIYVDDGLAVGRDRKQLDKLIAHLKSNFELKSMNCESYLGLDISRDLKEKTLSIVQARYIDKMLNRFKMADSNPVSTPEQVGAGFDESPKLPSDNQFKELLGSLLYLATCSRPDISHAVSMASRTSEPTQAHWLALKRILRYLKGTRELGIRFRWENPNELVGYSDADYANDAKTRKSTTGLCIFFGGAPIAWRCQRQPIITLSTTEAEYVAGCELVKEILPIREQLVELGQIEESQPTKILIDNQSTVKIASNESGQRRTKHIDIREKWLTEQVVKKKIEVSHISGDEQAADILTKPLYKSRFIYNRSKLLTQVISMLAVLALCSAALDARELRLTDPLTTTGSDHAFVKGDTRYRLTNIFLNPCERLFSYSGSVSTTETLIRHCHNHFAETHLDVLPNCQRLPDIGPDLNAIPLTYDCSDNGREKSLAGKCEVIRRNSRPSGPPDLGLDKIQAAWNQHKQRIAALPKLSREKRIIPFLAWGATIALVSVFTGTSVKTMHAEAVNREDIRTLANVTDTHSEIIRNATTFYEQYQDSLDAISAWSQEVEEKLGNDPLDSRLSSDHVFNGKRAHLIRAYKQWFKSQEQLLRAVNQAAAKKRVPIELGKMLNITNDIEKTANWSTLFECNYRLNNKSMVLNLDFLLPQIDDNIEILTVVPMSHYTTTNSSDESETAEVCWERYVGPAYIMHNKTSGCYAKLNEAGAYRKAVRAQLCLEPKNELHYPTNRSEHWIQESCDNGAPLLDDRIQIHEIDGVHKIYCYPYSIEIEGEQQKCPKSAFILEAHANYKIGNINHQGAYVDSSVSRNIRSVKQRSPKRARFKRSPVSSAVSTTITASSTTLVPVKPLEHTPRINISSTLRNITGAMNSTITKIKESIKRLPGSIHLGNTTIESILTMPMDIINEGVTWVSDSFKSLGYTLGFVTTLMVFVVAMPAIELIIIGLKVVKIPANLWLNSARRVTRRMSNLPISRSGSLTSLFQKKRKRWDDNVKMV